MSTESYIIDGARSPIGLKNGLMVGVRSDDLAAMVIKGLMARNSNIPPEVIEDVVLGCAFPGRREVGEPFLWFLYGLGTSAESGRTGR